MALAVDRHAIGFKPLQPLSPAMSLKIDNVRLELDDSEGVLPEKISERLVLGRESIAR